MLRYIFYTAVSSEKLRKCGADQFASLPYKNGVRGNPNNVIRDEYPHPLRNGKYSSLDANKTYFLKLLCLSCVCFVGVGYFAIVNSCIHVINVW